MQYPIKKIIEGRDSPLCIEEQRTVREAMVLMMENDFSQLPIIDEAGKLVGVISEQGVNQTCLHLGPRVQVFDLAVSHCCDSPTTLTPEADLIQALDLIQNSAAIVVVEEAKPIAIVTSYDLIQFFRDNSEGMIIIEDIEVTLRQLIDSKLPSHADRSTAIENAFGYRKRKGQSLPDYSRLSFGEYIELICDKKNWKHFSIRLQSRGAFKQYMEQVREIRNQMAHFRGRPDAFQEGVLRRARNWLQAHSGPSDHTTQPDEHSEMPLEKRDVQAITSAPSWIEVFDTLFDGWRGFASPDERLLVPFSEMEKAMGTELPRAAWEHRSWWNNDYDANPIARAWLREGFRVADMQILDDRKAIVLEPDPSVAKGLLFSELLQELNKKRPGLATHVIKKSSSVKFAVGQARYYFGWAYGMKDALRVELLIDSGDYAFNKQAFDELAGYRNAVNNEIGQPVEWQRIDGKNHCRIWSYRKMKFSDPIEQVETCREWAIQTMLDYIDALRPRIAELSLE